MDVEWVVGLLEEVAEQVVPSDFEERFGYPPAETKVERARDTSGVAVLEAEFPGRVPPDVAEFFGAVAAVELGELWNAYYIGALSWIVGVHRAGEPRAIRLDNAERDLMVLATNAGGDLFGIPLDPAGPVLALPHASAENGICPTASAFAIGWGPVADTFGAFLERLAEAALAGEPDPFDPHRNA